MSAIDFTAVNRNTNSDTHRCDLTGKLVAAQVNVRSSAKHCFWAADGLRGALMMLDCYIK